MGWEPAYSLDQSIAPDQVNRLLMTTRHSLVPWLYASNGGNPQVLRQLVNASFRPEVHN